MNGSAEQYLDHFGNNFTQIQTSRSKNLNLHNDTIYLKVIINLAKFMENSLAHNFRDFFQISKLQIGVAN